VAASTFCALPALAVSLGPRRRPCLSGCHPRRGSASRSSLHNPGAPCPDSGTWVLPPEQYPLQSQPTLSPLRLLLQLQLPLLLLLQLRLLLQLQLQLQVLAVILNAVKDPEEPNPTTTVRIFSTTTLQPLPLPFWFSSRRGSAVTEIQGCTKQSPNQTRITNPCSPARPSSSA
jgi:hypothetical protein